MSANGAITDTVGGEWQFAGMTEIERTALTLAATPYRYPGRREADVMEQLGWTATRFWAVVGGLLEREDCEREMAREVRRLRRLRDARAAARRGAA